MGGRTWVQSEVGKGSTFHFLVRFGLQQETSRRPWLTSEAVQGVPVLVVDDNRTNRRILEDMLATWGMLPTLAADGPSALAEMKRAAAAGRPHPLALIDVMMPDMDGFAVAERIKADRDLASCTLLLLSSAGQPLNRERCKELGIVRCMTKPVKQFDLLNAIRDALSAPGAEEQSPGPHAAAAPGAVLPLRILLAEDGLVNQQVAVGLLALRGHRVVVANNGKEALAALEKEPFDLVLMDVEMPEMDGLEATIAIRQKEKITGGHVWVLAMTAHAMKGAREHCLQAGMDGYLSKPIQARSLYEAVEAVRPAAAPAPEREVRPPVTDVLDWGAALERVGGETELLRTMASLFLQECTHLMPEIRRGITSKDCVVLRRAAHTLRASADYFTAKAAVDAASRLEAMGRKGDLSGAEEAWTALEYEINRLLPVLASYA